MIWFLCVLDIMSLINVAYSQAVEIAADSIQPNEDKLRISSMNNNTCVTFNATTGQRGPWYTKLRIEMNLGNMSRLEVRGHNLGCNQPGVKLYVYALLQPNSWTGVTETCAYDGYESAGTEICKYRCACATACDWLQIVRRPISGSSQSWSLCQVKNCPPGWTYKETPDRCYFVQHAPKYPTQAIAGCTSLHPLARLVEIRTAAENQAVAQIQGSTRMLVGGMYTNGSWRWLSNGENIGKFYWAPDEPRTGKNCLTVKEGASWNSGYCTEDWVSMCELVP